MAALGCEGKQSGVVRLTTISRLDFVDESHYIYVMMRFNCCCCCCLLLGALGFRKGTR